MEHFAPRAVLVPAYRAEIQMPAAAKKAQPKETPRQALCRELLGIQSAHSDVFARIDAIKTSLKKYAESDGKFRETFVDLGYVSVSPAKPEETIGEAPVIRIDAWNGLSEARQKKLIEQELVAIEAIVKGASYGQVRVKLHDQPEGDD
jgi:hypothetical protein